MPSKVMTLLTEEIEPRIIEKYWEYYTYENVREYLRNHKQEETLQAIRALSNIEWFLIQYNDISTGIIWDHLDYIFQYLEKDLTLK